MCLFTVWTATTICVLVRKSLLHYIKMKSKKRYYSPFASSNQTLLWVWETKIGLLAYQTRRQTLTRPEGGHEVRCEWMSFTYLSTDEVSGPISNLFNYSKAFCGVKRDVASEGHGAGGVSTRRSVNSCHSWPLDHQLAARSLENTPAPPTHSTYSVKY